MSSQTMGPLGRTRAVDDWICSSRQKVHGARGRVIVEFAKSAAAQRRLHELVPGGAHTYARGSDQYPAGMAPVIVRGKGARVVDLDGNTFVEYGMGLRAVTLGHGYRPVVDGRVCRAAADGVSFSRPVGLGARRGGALPRAGARRRHGEVREERLGRHHGRACGSPAPPRVATSSPLPRPAVLLDRRLVHRHDRRWTPASREDVRGLTGRSATTTSPRSRSCSRGTRDGSLRSSSRRPPAPPSPRRASSRGSARSPTRTASCSSSTR